MEIEVVYADITKETTDAIVNAANSGLYAGAGVCGAIHGAAGPELEEACKEVPVSYYSAKTGEQLNETEVAEYQADQDRVVLERMYASIEDDESDEAAEVRAEIERRLDAIAEVIGDREIDPVIKLRCPDGQAVATPGFDLPAEHVIHAVGPRWSDGESGEYELLRDVHLNIIRVADELGAKSVSLPAISTGIFGFPLDEAGEIAIAALKDAGENTGVETVRITVIDRANWDAYGIPLGLEHPEGEEGVPGFGGPPKGMFFGDGFDWDDDGLWDGLDAAGGDTEILCEDCAMPVVPDTSPGVWVHDSEALGAVAFDLNEDHAARPPEDIAD